MKNLSNNVLLRARFLAVLSASVIFAPAFSHLALADTATESLLPQKRRPQASKPKPKPKPKPESSAPLPQLSIDKTEHNFGEVYAGEELEHVFTVLNTGGAPLELIEGGPVGLLDQLAPERFLRVVSFNSDAASAMGFAATAAAMRPAPT